MEFQRIVESVDSDEEDADLETLRLAALRSRNQNKPSSSYREVVKITRGEDVRFVSQVSEERSVVQVNSHCEVWSSDQESSTTDYEDIELSDTNEKPDDTREICDIDDDNSSFRSDISVKDEHLLSFENNDVSIGDDFDMGNEDKNSDYGYVDIVFEHSESDEFDTVKIDEENDNVDETESFEVTEVVESEVSETGHEPDLDDDDGDGDDDDDDGDDDDGDDDDVAEENDLLDSEEDIIDNITITIQNDSVTVGCHDDSKKIKNEETEQKVSVTEGQNEDMETEEEHPLKNVSSEEQKQETQKEEIIENSKIKKNDFEAEGRDEKKEENKLKETMNNSKKESDSAAIENSSSSDSESESSSESSSHTSYSSDSHSDGFNRKTLKSKVVCEPQNKHVNDSNDKVLKASKEVAKKNEGIQPQKSQTNDGQVDDDRISIGGGASGRESDFDEDNEPVVKSTVRMRKFYSDSKSKSNLSPPSAESISDHYRSRSHLSRNRSQSHRNQSQRDRSPLRKDYFYSHSDRSRLRERLQGRNHSQNWSHERWRRSRSRERASYRNRHSDREYRHTRGGSRDVSSSRNNKNLDRSRSRSRGRKDVEKLSSKSEKPQQRLSSKDKKEPKEIKEKRDTKRLNSVAKPKNIEEKTQKSNGRRAENLMFKETSRLLGSIKKDGNVTLQNERHKRHDHGVTAASRHTSQKDVAEGQRRKTIEKGDLRERLKLGKPADSASATVSTSVRLEPKTVVKLCDSKPDLIIVKKFKTETKPAESKEKDLDARIAKIKHKNELIMRRQREIEADRRKYFT